jgi:hypothetical protein
MDWLASMSSDSSSIPQEMVIQTLVSGVLLPLLAQKD